MRNIKLATTINIVFFLIFHLLHSNPVVHLSKSEIQELKAKDKTLQIISSVNGGAFSLESKTATIDDDVKISIVFWKSNGTRLIPYSMVDDVNPSGTDQPRITYGSETDSLLIRSVMNPSLKSLGDISIKWYKIEEANGDDYSNTKPSWHWEDIPYKETEIVEWRDKFIVNVDVTPTVFEPVYCNGKVVGTMRYKAVVTIDGDTYSTPGKESKHKGSISKAVHRISLKGNTDNEVINYALAMCNLPYIWGSESFTGDKYDNHQAELFIGADCADFCVAAHQMADKQLPYDSIKDLSHTKVIAKQHSADNGNYLNVENQKITVGTNGVQVGDFIYWGTAHVGLFYEDKSDPDSNLAGEADGIFNEWDLVLHTLYAEPKVEAIKDIKNYGDLKIFRFKD